MNTWIKLTDEVMNDMEGMHWLATCTGDVVLGEHEWVQGRNPDRFVNPYGFIYYSDEVTHVMPMVSPKHPLEN